MTNGGLFLFAVGNVFMQAFIYSFGDFHHPEALMMIVLSALALSPAGRVLSLDDIWRRLHLREESKKFQASYILEEKSVFARWPLLLVQWLFALIYLSAALSKLDKAGLDWMNGYTMQYYFFQDGLRWNIPLGIWLGQQHSIAWFLSWVAILFESTFFLVLLFPRLAWIYVPLGIAFHIGIYLTMKAPFFQYIALYAVFVPWASFFHTVSRYLPIHNGLKLVSKKTV